MSTVIAACRIQRERSGLRQSVATGNGSTGIGPLLKEIRERLQGRGLGDADVAMLARLLREAEHIAANTDLLVRSAAHRFCTPSSSLPVRSAASPKVPKTA